MLGFKQVRSAGDGLNEIVSVLDEDYFSKALTTELCGTVAKLPKRQTLSLSESF